MNEYKLDVLGNCLFHGYDTNIEALKIDETLTKLMNEISSIELDNTENIKLKIISKRKMKNDVKKFVYDNLVFHKIGYINEEKLINNIKKSNINSIDDLISIYNKLPKMIEAFNLPIEFSYFNKGTTHFAGISTTDQEFNKELYSKLNTYYYKITLPKMLDETTPSTYLHELIHVQVESYKRLIKNYYNAEVLSIFMELVYSYVTNPLVFSINLNNRINNILVCFNYIQDFINDEKDTRYHNCYKYLVSILEAFNLFTIFLEDSNLPLSKNETIYEINNVFEGKKTVEEYLNYFDISLESSKRIEHTRRLISEIKP